MPANPFDLSASQSYAFTIDNVDLADSTGHALSLYPTQSAKNVNDVTNTGAPRMVDSRL